MSTIAAITAGLVLAAASPSATAREWTDATGQYHVEAELVAFNQEVAVLKKVDHTLVAVPLEKLSPQDQEYLKAKETLDRAQQAAGQLHTWTLIDGRQLTAKVVDYGRKTVSIARRRGKVYVGDRLFDNLPEMYQQMIPMLVGQHEKVPIDGKKGLEEWLIKNRGGPREFTVEGVILELANGDEYPVPFGFFAADQRKILEPGWRRWLEAQQDQEEQQRESFLLQSQAEAYQRDRLADRQIALMQLHMQGYEAGLFDLWEVQLLPAQRAHGHPLTVVVPARDSAQARAEAVSRHPGYVAGAAAKVQRK